MAREMALHQRAGIPPWAVLRMATSEGARLLGLGGKTGRLKPGLEADIVFLGRNPAADVSAVRDVRAVLTNGVLLSPPNLRCCTPPRL